MSEFFPKSKSFEERVKVELDLSNYVTKADLKKHNSCWYVGYCYKNWFS